MRAAVGLTLVLGLVTAAASAQSGSSNRESRERRWYADPSAVIAADLALSRIAREKGQSRALRGAAASGAVLFVPRAVDGLSWLKRQPDPAMAERWQPRTVWMSCDGGHAVSRGVWTRGATSGEYVTVWERQKKGGWKWLLREEAPAADLGDAPEMIAGRVAECSGLPRRSAAKDVPLLDPANSLSRDQSLGWSVRVSPDCGRSVVVEAWNGRTLAPVLEVRRAPPEAGCG